MSAENDKNFEQLKAESSKFKVETADEKKKIIIIDDDEIVLTLVRAILENDYEITTVNSGKAALDLFYQGYTPNLVLLDLVMPDMGGWDTYLKIRDLTRLHKVPIVIQSASDDPQDRSKAKEMGAVGFLKKPVNKEVLITRIGSIIN